MSQKNETAALVLSLLITVGLLAGGFWWFTQKSGLNLSGLNRPQPLASDSSADKTSDMPRPTLGQPNQIENFAQVQNVPTGLFNYGGSTSWAPI